MVSQMYMLKGNELLSHCSVFPSDKTKKKYLCHSYTLTKTIPRVRHLTQHWNFESSWRIHWTLTKTISSVIGQGIGGRASCHGVFGFCERCWGLWASQKARCIGWYSYDNVISHLSCHAPPYTTGPLAKTNLIRNSSLYWKTDFNNPIKWFWLKTRVWKPPTLDFCRPYVE